MSALQEKEQRIRAAKDAGFDAMIKRLKEQGSDGQWGSSVTVGELFLTVQAALEAALAVALHGGAPCEVSS